MATFVLVHGAWSGAQGFRLVRPLLSAGGHTVFTPSLTGVGDKVHLLSPQVGLSTHVQDVVNLILYEGLTDIVLLGFSYGGLVVTGALAHIGDRVRHLVYLDAFVPRDGDTAFLLNGIGDAPPITLGQPWLVPPTPRAFDDAAEGEFMNARRTPHPIRCFTEPVRVPRNVDEYPFTRTYIKASADGPDAPGSQAFWAAAAHAKASPAWNYREIATNHMVPSNRPAELSEALLELV